MSSSDTYTLSVSKDGSNLNRDEKLMLLLSGHYNKIRDSDVLIHYFKGKVISVCIINPDFKIPLTHSYIQLIESARKNLVTLQEREMKTIGKDSHDKHYQQFNQMMNIMYQDDTNDIIVKQVSHRKKRIRFDSLDPLIP